MGTKEAFLLCLACGWSGTLDTIGGVSYEGGVEQLKCPVCGDELIDKCPYCHRPLEVKGQRRCGRCEYGHLPLYKLLCLVLSGRIEPLTDPMEKYMEALGHEKTRPSLDGWLK